MNRRAFLAGLLASTALARARAQETLGGLLTDRVEGAGGGYVIVSTPSLAELLLANAQEALHVKRSSLVDYLEELEEVEEVEGELLAVLPPWQYELFLGELDLLEGRLGTIKGFEFIS